MLAHTISGHNCHLECYNVWFASFLVLLHCFVDIIYFTIMWMYIQVCEVTYAIIMF